MNKTIFYVDLYGHCALVKAHNRAQAEQWANKYFGKAFVNFIDIASEESIEYLRKMGGQIYEA